MDPTEKPTKSHRVRNAILWVGTTIISATLGALVSSYLERASPTATITDIGVSSQYNERFGKTQVVKIPLGDPLFRHLDESNWMNSFQEPSTNLDAIIAALSENQENVDTLLQKMDAFKASLPELRALLSAPPSPIAAESFFDKWEKIDSFIYPAIESRIKRGEFVSPRSNDHGDQKPYLLSWKETVQQGNELRNIYPVAKRGGKRTSYGVATRSSVEQDMRAIANALAFFDQDSLKKYLETLVDELQTYALHEQIRKEIEEYKRGYSRWAISLLISNAGSHPISFSPNATLYVNTRGTSVGNRFTIIDLESRTREGDPEPITITGGQSKLAIFASQKTVMADDSWKQILGLFDNLSRECFVILHPESDIWRTSSDLTSPTRVFGAPAGSARLTDKDIATHFRQ